MKKQLHIVGLQSEIHWEDIPANRAHFEDQIRRAAHSSTPDIIVIPETFTTGFTMNLESIDDWENGETLAWMQSLSAELGVAIVGSVAFMFNDGKARNRSLFVKPSGQYNYYDKRHLFSFGGESEFFEAGTSRTVVEYEGWKILLQICYDLRFPVFSRNHIDDPYDLVIYTANWPEPRIDAWTTLLKARAMENQAYVIGVSCTGIDGNGVNCPGESMCVDPKGTVLSRNQSLIEMTCDKPQLDDFRAKFPVLFDGRKD